MANRQQPNAKEKRWLESVCKFIDSEGLGILYGPEFEGRTDYQIHHVVGRAGKHNKVKIGHWFIIPVPWELHDANSNKEHNVTHFKHKFTERFGLQSDLWLKMINNMFWYGDIKHEYSKDVYKAIMDTRK